MPVRSRHSPSFSRARVQRASSGPRGARRASVVAAASHVATGPVATRRAVEAILRQGPRPPRHPIALDRALRLVDSWLWSTVRVADFQTPDELVQNHLPLVRAIAHQTCRELGMGLGMVDDLESAGREGLVDASRRYDPARGIAFATFAQHRIRGSMFDALRRETTLPRRAFDRLRALSASLSLNEACLEDLAAQPLPGVTSADLDAKLAEHLANLATAIATGLLAEPTIEEGRPSAVSPTPSPEEELERAQARVLLEQAVQALPDDERALVEGHYFRGRRFDAVAQDLGLSKSWASRLHTRAIGRLTARLSAAR